MSYESITEQLSDNCDCTEVKDSDVAELINIVSMASCWTQEPCETFLLSDRSEIIDLPECLDNCKVFEFIPFYKPFTPESFTFTLLEIDGITETEIPITEFSYSTSLGGFRLLLPLKSCKCAKPKCGCGVEYKLIVTYEAGYELIPDCLVPIFCQMLRLIKDKNTCDCSHCQECEAATEQLKKVYANGDIVSPYTDNYLATLIIEQYHRQLGLISLCENYTETWGIVV